MKTDDLFLTTDADGRGIDVFVNYWPGEIEAVIRFGADSVRFCFPSEDGLPSLRGLIEALQEVECRVHAEVR